MRASSSRCAARSTGRCLTFVLAGFVVRFAVPFHARAGRTGRGQKLPPQFGQTFSSTSVTQRAQKVHSNEQMAASVESGGSGSLQF
jgi:hypothetical protein